MENRYTYTLIFNHRDGEYEEFTHNTLEAAEEHFAMFDETDGDIYESIQLVQTDWYVRRDELLDIIEF